MILLKESTDAMRIRWLMLIILGAIDPKLHSSAGTSAAVAMAEVQARTSEWGDLCEAQRGRPQAAPAQHDVQDDCSPHRRLANLTPGSARQRCQRR